MTPNRFPSTTPSKGFTLPEILITLLVLSVAFIGLFGVFRTALMTSEKTEQVSASNEVSRLVTEQLYEDMESLYPLPLTGPSKDTIRAYPMVCRDNSPSRLDDVIMLDFYTTSSLRFDAQAPVRGINRVQWLLRPSSQRDTDGGQLYKLLRRELPSNALNLSGLADEEIPWATVELADTIRSLDLLFYDEQGLDTTSWDSSASDTLPSRLKTTLEFGGPQGKAMNFTLWWQGGNQ